MTMPCSIAGDMSIGHAGFSPAAITPTTTNVLVLSSPPHVVGDVIAPHVLGQAVHGGTVGKASTTVLAGNKGVARLMDKGDCQSLILGTGATVMVGG
jgi:hypothetical protein